MLSRQKNNSIPFAELFIGRSETITKHITRQLVQNFAAFSGDHSAIHVNLDAAQAAGYAEQVTHGVISQCYFSALIGTKLPGDSALLLELATKFHAPIFVGDAVTYKVVVIELHEAVRCIKLRLICKNQHGEKVVSGKALVKVQV